MEFPSFSFPNGLCPHGDKREMFADYGSYGQLESDSKENSTFINQKRHEEMSKKLILNAVRPTLPLNNCPNNVDYPFVDRVTDEVTSTRQLCRDFVRKLKYRRGLIKGKSGWQIDLKKKVKSIERTVNESGPSEKDNTDTWEWEDLTVPPWFSQLLDLYDNCPNTGSVPKVNSCFTGGCIASLPSQDVEGSCGLLLSAGGSIFDSLKLTSISASDNGIVQSSEVDHTQERSSICEVRSQQVHKQNFCCVRTTNGCTMYGVTSDEGRFKLDEIGRREFDSESVTSISLSPYLPTECLVANDQGSVYLWSLQRCDVVVQNKAHRFECTDPWRQVSFGAHPRQVVMADSTAVEMFDLRADTPHGCDLFALPNKCLHTKERVRVIGRSPVSSFQHWIATDFSLLLLDERFPGNPLLHWQHMLTTPPQYLTEIGSIGSCPSVSVAILAAQSPPEACCFALTTTSSRPPQAVCPPWRVCRIEDFTCWCDGSVSSDRLIVEERFQTSLSGVTSLGHDTGFTVFQMDSQGEIFYQMYKSDKKSPDKTWSSGPGSADLVPDRLSLDIGEKWLRELVGQVKNICLDSTAPVTDTSTIFDEIILQRPAHIKCALCMPEHQTVGGAQITETQMGDDVCQRCHHSIDVGSCLVDSVNKDKIEMKHEPPDIPPSLSDWTTLPHGDATSKLLIRLWQGNSDIQDLLEERDEEVAKHKESKKKQRQLTKKTDSQSRETSDEDVPSSQSSSRRDSESDVGNSSSLPVGHTTDGAFDMSMLKKESNIVTENTDRPYSKKTQIQRDIQSPEKQTVKVEKPRDRKRRLSGASSTASIYSSASTSELPGFSVTPKKLREQANSPYVSPKLNLQKDQRKIESVLPQVKKLDFSVCERNITESSKSGENSGFRLFSASPCSQSGTSSNQKDNSQTTASVVYKSMQVLEVTNRTDSIQLFSTACPETRPDPDPCLNPQNSRVRQTECESGGEKNDIEAEILSQDVNSFKLFALPKPTKFTPVKRKKNYFSGF